MCSFVRRKNKTFHMSFSSVPSQWTSGKLPLIRSKKSQASLRIGMKCLSNGNKNFLGS